MTQRRADFSLAHPERRLLPWAHPEQRLPPWRLGSFFLHVLREEGGNRHERRASQNVCHKQAEGPDPAIGTSPPLRDARHRRNLPQQPGRNELAPFRRESINRRPVPDLIRERSTTSEKRTPGRVETFGAKIWPDASNIGPLRRHVNSPDVESSIDSLARSDTSGSGSEMHVQK